jgi:hypothetical protein
MYKVDFATFCHAGDAHRLHAPGQLRKQVESNGYQFNNVCIVYQGINFQDYNYQALRDECGFNISVSSVNDIDWELTGGGIDVYELQFASNTDKAHSWKYHVVNHIHAINKLVNTDYIVFADNDCWMVRQPEHISWVERGIEILQSMPEIFIVSPNDGEPERKTDRMSQQMFLAHVGDFRSADFNQPNWDGNVNIPGGPMPEYWAMLEGRMELHCRVTGQYRYVLGLEYRYWHHNRLNKDDLFETNLSKY